MTTYRKIHGRSIQAVTTDPSESVAEGQVWYNTNSDTFKSVVASEAWSSASPMGRNPANDTLGGCGTPTAGLGFGGYSPPGGTVGLTEEYNGTGWATGGAMNTPEAAMGSFGTQTAAVSAGGSPNSAVTEEYNGTSWTTGNVMGTGRGYSASAGTETSGLIAGGNSPPILGNVEEYNGSTWSEQNNLGTSRYQFTGCGAANTAALVFGGSTPGDTGATEEYDGTNWTAGGSLNTGRRRLAGSGIQTSALAFGGNTTPPDTTRNLNEAYNGSTWAVSPATLATARTALGSTRTSSNNSSAVAFAGQNASGSKFKVTEEFNVSANVITAAAWAAGGNLPGPISSTQGGGTQTAGIQMSGQPNAPGTAATTAVNEYDGSSWTSGGALPAGAASYGGQASKNGTQTAMLYWKGHYSGNKNTVSSYDGSSWTAQSTFPNTDVYGGGCGTLTAALSAGGSAPSPPYAQVTTFESDGSYNWTAGGNMGNARYLNGTVGLQTNAVTAGGVDPSAAPVRAQTEEYDGSSWTAKSDMIIKSGITKGQCFGTNSDDMMVAGGPPNTTSCIQWNGTTWSTRPSISTGRHGGAGAGASSTSGWIAGGQSPFKTATEEFTGETTALNVKTLTQS